MRIGRLQFVWWGWRDGWKAGLWGKWDIEDSILETLYSWVVWFGPPELRCWKKGK